MSNRARYIVEAIVLEHRSPSELARTHKVSRSWIYKPSPSTQRANSQFVNTTA